MVANNGHVEMMSMLLENHAQVDLAHKTNGETPLYISAKFNRAEVVSLLLDKHAQVDLRNKNGATPLFIAAQYGHTEVVSLLLDNHAQVDLLNNVGIPPLFFATKDGRKEVVRLLLQAGADPLFTFVGATLLDIARGFCRPEVAALLQARIDELQS